MEREYLRFCVSCLKSHCFWHYIPSFFVDYLYFRHFIHISIIFALCAFCNFHYLILSMLFIVLLSLFYVQHLNKCKKTKRLEDEISEYSNIEMYSVISIEIYFVDIKFHFYGLFKYAHV